MRLFVFYSKMKLIRSLFAWQLHPVFNLSVEKRTEFRGLSSFC